MVDQFVASADIPANQIIIQSPTAGLGARPNSVVTVNVSAGTNTVRVPDVIGDEQGAASKLLSGSPLNFVVTIVLEASEVIEAGRVIRSEPLGDTAVAPGSAVTLYVSSGKNAVTVPNMVGKDGAAAVTELTTLGLVVTVSEQALPTGDASNGLVLAQSLPAGSSAQAGNAITLTVGKAEGTTP